MDLSFLNDIVSQILHLSPEILLILGLNAIGYATTLLLDKKWIPAVVMACGMVTYPLIASPGQAPPTVRHPEAVLVMQGLLLGVLAWVFHEKILKKLEEWLKPAEKPGIPPVPPGNEPKP